MPTVYVTVKEFSMDEKTIHAGLSLEEALKVIENEDKEWLEHCRVDVWRDGMQLERYYWSFDYNKFMMFKRDDEETAGSYSYAIAPKDDEFPLEEKDKLRRKGDGKLFTYVGNDHIEDEAYGRVQEMAVPVYLPDFERVETVWEEGDHFEYNTVSLWFKGVIVKEYNDGHYKVRIEVIMSDYHLNYREGQIVEIEPQMFERIKKIETI
ncbi:hypothetical protein AAXE64_08175 [Priestia megaterium]